VLLAALLLGDHPSSEDLPADTVVARLALPLRFGGFGLRVTTTLEADTPFRPFHPESPTSFSLMRQWAALRDAALGLWPGPAQELEGTRLVSILVDAQRLYG
jgi:hypothetical protein